eukprot:Rhum_TRINITY_DN15474_c17_g1::Rhum_TRINITY_DN15474_c17_g1_i1::g.160444::m.160444
MRHACGDDGRKASSSAGEGTSNSPQSLGLMYEGSDDSSSTATHSQDMPQLLEDDAPSPSPDSSAVGGDGDGRAFDIASGLSSRVRRQMVCRTNMLHNTIDFRKVLVRVRVDGLMYVNAKDLRGCLSHEEHFTGKFMREIGYIDAYFKAIEKDVIDASLAGRTYDVIERCWAGSEDNEARRAAVAAAAAAADDEAPHRPRPRNYMTHVYLPILRFITLNSLVSYAMLLRHQKKMTPPDPGAHAPPPLSPHVRTCLARLHAASFFNAVKVSPVFSNHAAIHAALRDVHGLAAADAAPGAATVPGATEVETTPLQRAAAAFDRSGGVGSPCEGCGEGPVYFPCELVSCGHYFCWACVVQLCCGNAEPSRDGSAAPRCPVRTCGARMILAVGDATCERDIGYATRPRERPSRRDAAKTREEQPDAEEAAVQAAGGLAGASGAGGGGPAADLVPTTQYECGDCKVRLNSYRQAQCHLNGHKHWKRVQQLIMNSRHHRKREYVSQGIKEQR